MVESCDELGLGHRSTHGEKGGTAISAAQPLSRDLREGKTSSKMLCKGKGAVWSEEKKGSSLVAQWVKDQVLSLLWHGFDHWPGNFHVWQVWPKKKKKKRKRILGRQTTDVHWMPSLHLQCQRN